MQLIDAFSLEKHKGPYEKWPLRTRLYFNNNYTETSIPGFVIEAQYKCKEGFLIITSWDCPYEEGNDFILLSPQFKLLAKNHLLWPYATFLLEAHWPISESALLLHYHGPLNYRLTIQRRWFDLGLKLTLKKIKITH